jgi:hypothetical protein
MTADEAIRLTKKYLLTQFPKSCGACGRRFETLAQYLRDTRQIESPVTFEPAGAERRKKKPAGVFSFAACACGAVLTVDSRGMSLPTYWRLMVWSRGEALRRGITWRELMAWLRAEIDRQILSDSNLG